MMNTDCWAEHDMICYLMQSKWGLRISVIYFFVKQSFSEIWDMGLVYTARCIIIGGAKEFCLFKDNRNNDWLNGLEWNS